MVLLLTGPAKQSFLFSFASPPPVVRSRKWEGLEGLDERTAGSLIPETLEGMEEDEEFQLTGIPNHGGQYEATQMQWPILRKAIGKGREVVW